MTHTLESFRASRQPCSDALWDALLEMNGEPPAPRSAHFEYAGGNALYEADGGFWPYAWWYAPLRKESLAEAEASLYKWFCEFH